MLNRKSLVPGEGLLFDRCYGVHTFGMRFAIDVMFLDQDLRVIRTVRAGRIIGRSNGVWCVEWNWMPANYLIGIQLDAPKPLEERVDPADTGLPRGLALIGESDVSPMENAHYSHRFGVAVVNRLSAAVIELGTGGTYTVPTGYAH